MKWPLSSLNAVFSSQAEKLIARSYHNIMGVGRDDFLELLTPLREQLLLVSETDIPDGHLPLLIVVTSKSAPLRTRLDIINDIIGSEEVIIGLREKDVVTETKRPDTTFYLAIDVESGEKTKIQFPEMGTVSLTIRNRHAMTIDEGVSLLTQGESGISFEENILLSGSCYVGWGKEEEIPFVRIYTGEFDYGIEPNHTMHKKPYMTPVEHKMFWKTPSCRTWLTENGLH